MSNQIEDMAAAKFWTPAQTKLANEYMNTYAIERSEIYFIGDKPEPRFSTEALGQLGQLLGGFTNVTFGRPVYETDCVSVECTVGRGEQFRSVFGTCFYSEVEPLRRPAQPNSDPETETNLLKLAAIGKAEIRALRKGYRAFGFNVHRSHEAAKAAGAIMFPAEATDAPDANEQSSTQKEIQLLAREVGLVTGSNRSLYYEMMGIVTGRTSSKQFDGAQEAKFVAFLRALKQMTPEQRQEYLQMQRASLLMRKAA
jgi:hypothetical protein